MSTEPFFYSLSVGHTTCLFPFFLHLKKRWYYNNFFLSWYAVKDKPYRTTVETVPENNFYFELYSTSCISIGYPSPGFELLNPVLSSCPNNTYRFLKCCNSGGKGILSIGSQAIPVLHSEGKGIPDRRKPGNTSSSVPEGQGFPTGI